MNITHDRVRQQVVNILRAWGMAEDLVQTTADAMIETDLLGVDSHGISMLMTYDLNNKKLPEGWVIDGEGKPVTDPALARQMMNDGSKSGGITPVGGSEVMASYKGYGLAMMAHILGGTLNGGSFSPIREKTQGEKDPDNIGHFFLAIDPKAFRGEGEFENDLDEVIDILHATPPLDPSRPVLVAGDPEAAERERRLKAGIPIPEKLDQYIREICGRCGAAYCLT